MGVMAIRSENAVDKFIARWQSASGSERANYQLFVHELCTLLELPTPDPAREDTRDNAYVFERRITFRHGDGTRVARFRRLLPPRDVRARSEEGQAGRGQGF